MTNDDYRRALSLAQRLKDLACAIEHRGDVVRLTMTGNIPKCLGKDAHWNFTTVEEAISFASGLREGLWIAKKNRE